MIYDLTIPEDRFYYVRHGETEANATQIISGQRDVALTARGGEQAKNAGRIMKGVAFDAICASPLKRAWNTAEPIARATGHEIIPVPDLMERNWGVHQGQPIDSVTLDAVPKGGESRLAFAARVMRGLNAAFAHGEVVIVAHAGMFHELCIALDVDFGTGRVPNGTPLRFERVDGEWRKTVLE